MVESGAGPGKIPRGMSETRCCRGCAVFCNPPLTLFTQSWSVAYGISSDHGKAKGEAEAKYAWRAGSMPGWNMAIVCAFAADLLIECLLASNPSFRAVHR